MYIGVCVKYSVLLSLLIKLIFGKKFRKKNEISNFIKIVQWELSALHAGRRTDRQTYRETNIQTDRWIDWQRDRQTGMTDLIFAFSNTRKHLIVHDLMKTPVPSPRSALSIFFYHKVELSIHITELCQCFVWTFCLCSQGKTLMALFPPPLIL